MKKERPIVRLGLGISVTKKSTLGEGKFGEMWHTQGQENVGKRPLKGKNFFERKKNGEKEGKVPMRGG